jgi:hypothetical protein
MAERLGHPVRPIIVLARNVVDAIATTLQLQASEVFVGESSTLSSADQRPAGEVRSAPARRTRALPASSSPIAAAAPTPIHRRAPPSLTPVDLDLIHRAWSTPSRPPAARHHHDVLRGAHPWNNNSPVGPTRRWR